MRKSINVKHVMQSVDLSGLTEKDLMTMFDKKMLHELPAREFGIVMATLEGLEDDYDSIKSYNAEVKAVAPKLHPERKYLTLDTLGFEKKSSSGYVYVVVPGDRLDLNSAWNNGKPYIHLQQTENYYMMGFTQDLTGTLSHMPPFTQIELVLQTSKKEWEKMHAQVKKLKHEYMSGNDFADDVDSKDVAYWEGEVGEVVQTIMKVYMMK